MSGCDYLERFPNIGIEKAMKIINDNAKITEVFKQIQLFALSQGTTSLLNDYFSTFQKAVLTFRHQLVFDPIIKKQIRANAVTNVDLTFAGLPFENAVAHAQGKISARFDDYRVDRGQYLKESLILSLPKDIDENMVKPKNLDIWSSLFEINDTQLAFIKDESHEAVNEKIYSLRNGRELIQISLFREYATERSTPTVSGYWEEIKNQEPDKYDAYQMGKVWDPNYSLPFRCVEIDQSSETLQCICGNNAEKRLVKYDEHNECIYSNREEFIGASFNVCNTKACSMYDQILDISKIEQDHLKSCIREDEKDFVEKFPNKDFENHLDDDRNSDAENVSEQSDIEENEVY
jgi:hypothetical protein